MRGHWCGGEGGCARKHGGGSAQEERVGVKEKAFRARWGARRERGEADV